MKGRPPIYGERLCEPLSIRVPPEVVECLKTRAKETGSGKSPGQMARDLLIEALKVRNPT